MKRVLLLLGSIGLCAAEGPFIASPYLQYDGSVYVLWHAPDDGAAWRVDYSFTASAWHNAELTSRRAAVRRISPYRIHEAKLGRLPPSAAFQYRVYRNSQQVFAATGTGWKPLGAPTRIAVVGDTGYGSSGEKQIVFRMHQAKPDYVVITGDIVYEHGQAADYWKNYFPIYNAASPSPTTGAPLLRSTITLAAPGNHDTDESRNLLLRPDGLAFFLFWKLPGNGFDFPEPRLIGSAADQRAFRQAAGSAFPKSANYSFDSGDIHWTVIDSNTYLIWNTPLFRDWLVKDLQSAAAKWKFVAFHHAAFHSSQKHQFQRQMRNLSDIFEAGGVDIVWAGHVHNYQRSFPLRGEQIDKQFDGSRRTKAGGVIHIVTGAGGARLHTEGRDARPSRWQPFTAVYFSRLHSFTLVEAAADKLLIRQIDALGQEQDRFTLTH
ncbi:MAG TPA: metallophosphoesterase [Bryobacteraceae bacterium]|nr:metallophosphoesterase [Bryobacteraceae bacterium]